MIRILPFVLFWMLSCRALAGHGFPPGRDSLLVEASGYGELFIHHRMEAGQTIYSLSRFFGLRPATVFSWNPELDTSGAFQVGQEIRIPLPTAALVRPPLDSAVAGQFLPVYYVVRRGDTFYAIANRLFQVPLQALMDLNRQGDSPLRRGQHLQVGWIPATGIPDSLQAVDTGAWNERMSALRIRFLDRQSGRKLIREQGAAYWQRERKPSHDYYALHRHAPKDAVLELFNPTKNKTVYAKVLGTIPQQAYGDDVLVVLSPSLARLLEAKDARFFVEVRYYK